MATPPSPRFNIVGDVFTDVTIIPLTWFSIVDCRAHMTWGKRISMAINAATVSSKTRHVANFWSRFAAPPTFCMVNDCFSY